MDEMKVNSTNHQEENGSARSARCIPKRPDNISGENRFVDITAMIRSLQRTEGLADCFRRGQADCDELDCAWRQYCLGSTEDSISEKDR